MGRFEIHAFLSFTLAIILLFVGKIALMRFETLRRCSIPEPLIGGFLAAAVVGVVYFFSTCRSASHWMSRTGCCSISSPASE